MQTKKNILNLLKELQAETSLKLKSVENVPQLRHDLSWADFTNILEIVLNEYRDKVKSDFLKRDLRIWNNIVNPLDGHYIELTGDSIFTLDRLKETAILLSQIENNTKFISLLDGQYFISDHYIEDITFLTYKSGNHCPIN